MGSSSQWRESSSQSCCASSDDERAREAPVDAQVVPLHEIETFHARHWDRIGQDGGGVSALPHGMSGSLEGSAVQRRKRLTLRRRRPTVWGVHRDRVDDAKDVRDFRDVADAQGRHQAELLKDRPASRDHVLANIAANEARADEARLEEDAARSAERVEERATFRDARQVDEDPRESRMERDREEERTLGYLSFLERPPVDRRQTTPQVVLLPLDEPDLLVGVREVHGAPDEIPDPPLDLHLVVASLERVHADAERAVPELERLGGGDRLLERAPPEELIDAVREPEAAAEPRRVDVRLHRQKAILSEKDLARPSGCLDRGQGLGPREGWLLPGQLDEKTHVKGERNQTTSSSLLVARSSRLQIASSALLQLVSTLPFSWGRQVSTSSWRNVRILDTVLEPDTVTYKQTNRIQRRVLRVRPFGPNDLAAVAAIVKDSLRENYPASLYLDIHRWWRDGFLVAEWHGSAVGFLAAAINAPQQARILMLAVYATHRRHGFGSALMNAFLNECGMRGVKSVELEVRKSNVEAIGFYNRYGFETTSVLPRFYTDGEDGCKMMRHL